MNDDEVDRDANHNEMASNDWSGKAKARINVISQHLNQSKTNHREYEAQSSSRETHLKPKKNSWLDSLDVNPKMFWPRKYLYTIERQPGLANLLTKKQRDQYEDNGYLVLRNLLPPSLAQLLRNSENASSIQLNELLSQLFRLPQILHYVEAFCGENIMAMQSLLINQTKKTLREGDSFHQDLFYLPYRPADRIVCVWISLDETRFETIPTTHRTGRLQNVFSDLHGVDNKVFYEQLSDANSLSLENQNKNVNYVDLKCGDVLFYHPLLLHKLHQISHNNLMQHQHEEHKDVDQCKTNAILLHYASSECEYVRVERNFPIAKNPSGIETFPDEMAYLHWQNRGHIVKGRRINL